MACLSWNCRGLGHPRAVRALHHLVKSHKPTFIFLIETKLWKHEWESIKATLGFPNGLFVDARGRKGGLALLWPRNLNISVLSFSSHHIEAIVDDNTGTPWRFVGFYGHHDVALRKHSWELLKLINEMSSLPTVFIGDFNEVLSQHEHSSNRRRPQHQINRFRAAIDDCHLMDMGFKGFPFTWTGNFIHPCTVRARLDRGFCSTEWFETFPSAEITHLTINRSDHLPLLLVWKIAPGDNLTRNKKMFKFESNWCQFEGCEETVAKSWALSKSRDHGTRVFDAIRLTRLGLLKWKRVTVGNVPKRIEEKQVELDILNQGVITEQTKVAAIGAIKLIDQLREAHEKYWQQRARAFWSLEGDRCTKYFHARASMRKKSNTICGFFDDNENWITDRGAIIQQTVDFYQGLFSSSSSYLSCDIVLENCLPSVSNNMAAKLLVLCNKDEVRKGLFDMSGLKAPGPDGLPALFFQKYWEICGDDISDMVCSFVNDGYLLRKINFTHITLIPKVEEPVRLNQFRPISLCNVISKLIAKVIANRLKIILPEVVSDTQSAFVPQRLISDNVLMAFEAHHYIKNRKTGNRGLMSLKLDMEKAYDRIEWSYLKAVMLKLGFPSVWVTKIMMFVESVSYSILLNGEQTGFIKPGRGLRQGDPLSPYLFILCTEGLIGMIKEAINKGDLQGLNMGRNSSTLSHLLFADDSLLFGSASTKEAHNLMTILKLYERLSGQKINLDKSAVFFSPNVDLQTKAEIIQILQMVEVESHGKYLGLPAVVGASKAEIFSSIKDSVKKRVEGWQSKLLSKAGKEVLIKSTIQVIPNYAMQCFKIPIKVCNDLNSLTSNFFWGSSPSSKKIHWTSWRSLCKPKAEGGMGFKDVHSFNLALLCKQAWRLSTAIESPLALMFKSKYHPDTTFLRAKIGAKPSFTWRSIISARDVLLKGIAWKVGNGRSIFVWGDKWTTHTDSRSLITPIQEELKELLVADLIDFDTGTWKESLIRELFFLVDCEAILNIKLDKLEERDTIFWFKHPQGTFSVKEAYNLIIGSNTKATTGPSNKLVLEAEMTKLWSINLPGKVKHFLWRLYNDNLPTCHNLIKRNVNIQSRCQFCGEQENSLHLFLYCPYTREVCSGISIFDLPPNINSTRELIMVRWWDLDAHSFQLWVIAIWKIWHQRNLIIHGKETKPPEDICSFAISFISSMSNAKEAILVPPDSISR